MNINEHAVRTYDCRHEMTVFDHLPSVIRAELRETSVPYTAIEVAELLVGGHSVPTVLAVLRGENGRVQRAYCRRIGVRR